MNSPGSQTEPAPAQHCFQVGSRHSCPSYFASLDARPAAALAALLPLLGCGEEAAAVSFHRLSRTGTLDAGLRRILRTIADDERCHDAMLRGLRTALPRASPDATVQARARRFHLGLSRGGTSLHLARIAGLDAAVCTIVSRLLRPGNPVARDDATRAVLGHIRRDEARHVVISRDFALASPDREAVRGAAADARTALADLLASGSDAFEALGVDPDLLLRDVGSLLDGLLPR